MSPLTQGLNYRSACDSIVFNEHFKAVQIMQFNPSKLAVALGVGLQNV